MHFFVTASRGTEGALKDELRALGLRVRGDRGGVHVEGELEAGMRACLWSRIGMRVLLLVAEAEASGEDGLYEAALAVPWEDHLTARSTFSVDATVKSSRVTHSHYAALKVKDAIVDRLRERQGDRPSVDVRRPDVPVVLHLAQDHARLYLDLSGEPLHRRGWRTDAAEAPLRETLAAAMLAIGGHDPERPLVDPMCGSGTIVIEAALRARRIAPGRGRHFAFQRWPALGEAGAATFRALQEEARALALPKAPAELVARDRFADLELVERNAHRAGVLGSLTLERRDARDLAPLPEAAQIFLNPPYGERLAGKRLQLEGLFRELGEAFRALPGEHVLVALAGSPHFTRAFGGRRVLLHPLMNGPLEAPLVKYASRG